MTERGRLRVYLGAAPGVGKTVAMLDEGLRRRERGTDVVVALAETHGRTYTAERLAGLEQLPRRSVEHRGATLDELDLPAVLRRRPQVALVDELAHTNAPGLEHDKRWQDVEALLEAGIDVISTVNVQHLESLNDVVEAITGAPQRETVPDAVVRAADQVELVDMAPQALRRRLAHGNVYAPHKVDAALSNYFRQGNLTALRELALLWLADSVDAGLRRYREQHGIDSTWETRERVVVALTGGPEGDTLIRRAARIAARAAGGEVLAVHVVRADGLAGSSVADLERQRLLVESLGGTFHSVAGEDVARAVLDFARGNNATQIVIGASRRNPLMAGIGGPGTGMTITRRSGSIDVHVVSHDFVGRGRHLPRLTRGLTMRRRIAGVVTAVVLLAVLVPLGLTIRDSIGFGTELLLFLLVVVAATLVGGFWPALATAVAASLLLNYFFVAPTGRLSIDQPENIFALVAFVLIGVLVSRVVDTAARRTSEAARANAEAETLAALAGSVLRGESAVPALLDRVRETFAATDVSLLRRLEEAPASGSGGGRGVRGTWQLVADVGASGCLRPEDADAEVAVGDDLVLTLRGRRLDAADQRLLGAFASQVAVAYRQRQLTEAAGQAADLAATDRTRTALLNALSHDLRTPIATAKTAVASLRATDVAWSDDDRAEFLETAEDALDQLTALVTDLLDLSRIRAGTVPLGRYPIALDDVVARAVRSLDDAGLERLESHLPTDLPDVGADPALLERVVANLVENALRYAPPPGRVTVSASDHAGVVELRIADSGPGIPETERDAAFLPFQRRSDHVADGAGVGLGLAIVRGFTDAMGGEVRLEDTPGGGLTAVVALPVADEERS